ncbi:hypothetical protein [Spiroplasma endosymbiont of Eupeodes luniger]|uniref:hypothetical protein n=1 Tax=Spiroplasma endosymbiont of Eupeodes luniger TaxID=3066300 RepID=UPI0030CDC82B
MSLKERIKKILNTKQNKLIQIPRVGQTCQYSVLVEESAPVRRKMNWKSQFNMKTCNKKIYINKIKSKDQQIFLEGGCVHNHLVIRKIWKEYKYWNVINIKN